VQTVLRVDQPSITAHPSDQGRYADLHWLVGPETDLQSSFIRRAGECAFAHFSMIGQGILPFCHVAISHSNFRPSPGGHFAPFFRSLQQGRLLFIASLHHCTTPPMQ
jgi:hypothetical protein